MAFLAAWVAVGGAPGQPMMLKTLGETWEGQGPFIKTYDCTFCLICLTIFHVFLHVFDDDDDDDDDEIMIPTTTWTEQSFCRR